VRQTHPIECAVVRALRGVHVVVPVNIEQAGSAGTEPAQADHDGQGDQAVAANHQHGVAGSEDRIDPLDEELEPSDDLADVLRSRTLPVWAPDLGGRIAVVAHLQAHLGERSAETRGAMCCWCQVLAGNITPDAAGTADQRNARHVGGARSQRHGDGMPARSIGSAALASMTSVESGACANQPLVDTSEGGEPYDNAR